MNAERLLEVYEQISEAPEAIARLRRFVLDLAVRGKLVEQDAEDEPASVQCERIAAAKARLDIKERKAKRRLVDPSLTEVSFDLPAGWADARFADLVRVVNGRAYKKPELLSEGTPVLRVGNLFTSDHWYYSDLELEEDKYCDKGDLIYAWSASFGPFIWDGPRVIYHYHIWKLPLFSEDDLSKRYIFLFLQQKTREIKDAGHGISMIHMTKEKMEQLVVPLPPLAEQHRIVAKVDELMALCDRLEEARKTREEVRDKLTAASLARLTAPETTAQAEPAKVGTGFASGPATSEDNFPTHAAFALEALPALTTRPDQIKTLRQTILNLAVRGKLVEQETADEPASKMLERIGTLPPPARYKKRSPELVPGDCGLSINKPHLAIPNGWLWVPLVQVARLESGHTPSRNRPDWWDGDVPWMGLVDARAHNNGRIFETIQHTNDEGLSNSAARLLPAGTVCFSRTASVGYVVIMGRSMATSQDFVNWVPTEAISSEWLQLVMIAERPAIPRFSKGAVHQTIYYPAWLSMHVALPPLAEQHRIVAKVDALMALYDRLEAALTTTDSTRTRLLEALLHEALEPAAPPAMEATE
ncbi:restriction endonuclease subunit S [Pseudophaeobacter sp. 1A16562]|uniref:restriction endonuclease subunit S n=1 Tax=Pseudophaeobacter sp. 1A16562 TaxID=3098143 RepID=UPI0034D4ECB2